MIYVAIARRSHQCPFSIVQKPLGKSIPSSRCCGPGQTSPSLWANGDRPTEESHTPPVDLVKKSAFWSDPVYADLRARLTRPAPTLTVSWSGTYVTFNTRDRAAPSQIAGSNATVVHDSQEEGAQQQTAAQVIPLFLKLFQYCRFKVNCEPEFFSSHISVQQA